MSDRVFWLMMLAFMACWVVVLLAYGSMAK